MLPEVNKTEHQYLPFTTGKSVHIGIQEATTKNDDLPIGQCSVLTYA